MTTEQRERIYRLERYLAVDRDNIYVRVRVEDLDTVLSLIKQLESEKEIHVGLEHQYKKEYLDMLDLTKKYKRQIDLMAEQLAGLTIWNSKKEEALILIDKEDVKKYFERQVNSSKQ